jgi:transcriptional regulator with XRE-family HTH domain
LTKGIAHQLRASRDRLEWSQQELAEEAGMNQNAISRLESPGYGKPTLTTLKRLAAAMDIGLIVRFVPFSQMIDWVSGVPRVDRGLTSESLAVPSFDAEEKTGVCDTSFSTFLVSGNSTVSHILSITTTGEISKTIEGAEDSSIKTLMAPSDQHKPMFDSIRFIEENRHTMIMQAVPRRPSLDKAA